MEGKVELKHVEWVEEAVKDNPWDMNARISLLKVLCEAGLVDKLEVARRCLVDTMMPMSEELWLPWMEEKAILLRKSMSEGGEQARDIGVDAVVLLRRALADCPSSLRLWKLYTTTMQMMSVISGSQGLFLFLFLLGFLPLPFPPFPSDTSTSTRFRF